MTVITNACFSQNGEEFVGPFASWADVKLRFNAKGDGKTDDTRAIQAAIDSLSVLPVNYNVGSKGYTTIYLPKGTYRITKTLAIQGKIGFTIVGEDPVSTILLWDGPGNDTLLWANGSAYYRISRLSFDAGKRTGMEALGIHWKERWQRPGDQSFAALNIEISDCYFLNRFKKGISGGTTPETGTSHNDSEVLISRCRFIECTGAGIDIKGYNALDYWIWDCRFMACTIAVSSFYGNYHLYRSYFERSAIADIYHFNGYYSSVRGCYSLNSAALSVDSGASCNPFKRVFQGNTVISPDKRPIYFAHLGKLTLLDNFFSKNSNPKNDPTVHYSSWCEGIYEVLSVNNRFPEGEPFRMSNNVKAILSFSDVKGKVTDVNMKSSGLQGKDNFLASQQSIPAKKTRVIFEVPRNASAQQIQKLIDKAATLKGTRPVIHFSYGSFEIDKPLTIPRESDMQLIGDGFLYATILKKAIGFPSGRPMLEVQGPSYIVIREMQFGDNGSARDASDMILFKAVDQAGSQLFIDQLNSSATNAVQMDKQKNLYVQKDNSFFSYGNVVNGAAEGSSSQAGLFCFGGQYAGTKVTGNGNFLAKDCWWEGNERVPLNIEGSGRITLDGFMLAPNGVDEKPSIRFGKFSGTISLMNAYVQGGMTVTTDNPSLKLLLWNIHFMHEMDPLRWGNTKPTYQSYLAGITTQCFRQNDVTCKDVVSRPDKSSNMKNGNDFINETLLDDRRRLPRKFSTVTNSSTNLLLTRISVGPCATAIRIIP